MPQSFFKDESGATVIEYALIAGFVAMVIIVGLEALGTSLSNTFNGIATKLK